MEDITNQLIQLASPVQGGVVQNELNSQPEEVDDITDQLKSLGVQTQPTEDVTQETNVFHEAKKGAIAGVRNIQSMGYGLEALAGQVTGIDALKQGGLKGLQETAAVTPHGRVPSYADIQDVDDLANYLSYGIMSNLPNMAISYATGGVGAVGGRAAMNTAVKTAVAGALKNGLEQGLTKEAAKEAAIAIGKKVASKGIERGAIAGAATGSIGMESGMIAGDQLTETGKIDPVLAISRAIPAGLLDIVPEWYLAKKLGAFGKLSKPQITGIIDRVKYAGKEGAKQFTFEGVTESGQSLLERSAVPGKSLTNKEAIDEYIDSLLLGGIIGGVMGGGGNFIANKPRNILDKNTGIPGEEGGVKTETATESTTEQTTEQRADTDEAYETYRDAERRRAEEAAAAGAKTETKPEEPAAAAEKTEERPSDPISLIRTTEQKTEEPKVEEATNDIRQEEEKTETLLDMGKTYLDQYYQWVKNGKTGEEPPMPRVLDTVPDIQDQKAKVEEQALADRPSVETVTEPPVTGEAPAEVRVEPEKPNVGLTAWTPSEAMDVHTAEQNGHKLSVNYSKGKWTATVDGNVTGGPTTLAEAKKNAETKAMEAAPEKTIEELDAEYQAQETKTAAEEERTGKPKKVEWASGESPITEYRGQIIKVSKQKISKTGKYLWITSVGGKELSNIPQSLTDAKKIGIDYVYANYDITGKKRGEAKVTEKKKTEQKVPENVREVIQNLLGELVDIRPILRAFGPLINTRWTVRQEEKLIDRLAQHFVSVYAIKHKIDPVPLWNDVPKNFLTAGRQMGLKVEMGEKALEVMDAVRNYNEENAIIPPKDPNAPLTFVDLSNILKEMHKDINVKDMKMSEFLDEFAKRTNSKNKYVWLGKLADTLKIPVNIIDKTIATPHGSAAAYNLHHTKGELDNIVIAPRRFILYKNTHDNAESTLDWTWNTLAHEILHGLYFKSPNQKVAEAKIKEFYKDLQKYRSSADEWVEYILKYVDTHGVTELVSIAFTDSHFANWLNGIQVSGVNAPSKTLWGQLKEIVLGSLQKSFGLSKTKLDELNDILDMFLEYPAEVIKAEDKAPIDVTPMTQLKTGLKQTPPVASNALPKAEYFPKGWTIKIDPKLGDHYIVDKDNKIVIFKSQADQDHARIANLAIAEAIIADMDVDTIDNLLSEYTRFLDENKIDHAPLRWQIKITLETTLEDYLNDSPNINDKTKKFIENNVLSKTAGSPAPDISEEILEEEEAESTNAEPTAEELRAKAEREARANVKLSVVELPEMVKLVKELTGLYPRVRKYLGKQLGKFRPEEGGAIDLKWTLNPVAAARELGRQIGHLADWLPDKIVKDSNILGKIAHLNNYFKHTLAEYPGGPGELTKEDRDRIRRDSTKEAKRTADEPIVEYITKMVNEYEDVTLTPEMVLQLFNDIITEPWAAREFIRRADNPTKMQIAREAMRGTVAQALTELPELKRLKGQRVVTEVKVTPAPGLSDKVKQIYKQKLQEEINKRALYELNQIEAELKELSRRWNPFDPTENKKYTNERYSADNLYADAVSVLLNNPELMDEVAPTFKKAFVLYLSENPEFKKVYEDIQETLNNKETVQENRKKFIDDMGIKGAVQRRREAQEREGINNFTFKHALHTVRKWIDTKNIKYIERVAQMVKSGAKLKDWHRIDYFMETLPYIDSEISAFYTEAEQIFESIAKDGFTLTDLHEILELERAAYERYNLMNPGGIGGVHAEEVLAHIKETITREKGPEYYKRLHDAADNFRMLYQRRVVKVVEQADFLPKHLMDYMLNNDYYVTFKTINDVDEKIKKHYGDNYGAKIYRQYGGIKEIDNVAVATLLKGASLIRAARFHETKVAVLTTLAEYGFDGEVIPAKKFENAPEGYGEIFISPHGHFERYFIDKEMADAWDRDTDRTDVLFRLGVASKHIITKLFIEWNPAWIVANPVRDFFGTWKKMDTSLYNTFKAYKSTFRDALDVAEGRFNERELRLLRDRAVPGDRFFNRGERLFSKEVELLENKGLKQREKDFYSRMQYAVEHLNQKGYRNWLLIPPILRFLSKMGKVGERWGKFAGDEIIQMQRAMGKEVGINEARHIIQTRAGTPNAYAEGVVTRWSEIIFPYSRMSIQDTVSGIEAAKQRPAAYLFKTLLLNVMPKVFLAMCVAGAFGDDMRESARKITTYFRRMYNCIPLGTIAGQTVFLKIPQDYTGQAVGAIVDSIFEMKFTGMMGTLGAVAGYQPFNANPFISTAIDWAKYYSADVVPINFYGNKVIPDRAAAAGGLEAAKYLGRATWNEFFGGLLYKFKSDNLKRVEPWQKELLGVTPFNAIGKFVGITDTGIEEEARVTGQETASKEAKRQIEVRERTYEVINSAKGEVDPSQLADLYVKLVEEGKINPVSQTGREFVKSYLKISQKRDESPYFRAYTNLYTNAARADILQMWKDTRPEEQYRKIMEDLMEAGLINSGVFKQQGSTDLLPDDDTEEIDTED
jgi:hypothetical protein